MFACFQHQNAFFFLIGAELLYNVVLVFGVKLSESVIKCYETHKYIDNRNLGARTQRFGVHQSLSLSLRPLDPKLAQGEGRTPCSAVGGL